MTGLRRELITSSERLFALEPALWDLFDRDPSATPFQSPAWLLPFAEVFLQPGSLRALACFGEDRLVAFLPLALMSEGTGRVLGWLGQGISDYLDALIDPAEVARAVPLLCSALQDLSREANRTVLSDVPRDSALAAFTQNQPTVRLTGSAVCPRLPLVGTFLEYFRTLPAWVRRNHQQTERRLRRIGAPSWRHASTSDLEDFLQVFFALHAARWSKKGALGVLSDSQIQAFHRRAAPRLLTQRLLDLSVLFLDRRPIAVTYLLARSDAYLYLSGFDPSLEKLSLGTLAVLHSIEGAFAAGLRNYDFLRGSEPYKYALGGRDTETYCLSLESRATSQGVVTSEERGASAMTTVRTSEERAL